jgi:hypothetical protein
MLFNSQLKGFALSASVASAALGMMAAPVFAFTTTLDPSEFSYTGDQTAGAESTGSLNTSVNNGFNSFFDDTSPVFQNDYTRMGAAGDISGSDTVGTRTATSISFVVGTTDPIILTFDYAFLASNGTTPSLSVGPDTFTVTLLGGVSPVVINLNPTFGTDGFTYNFGSLSPSTSYSLVFTLTEGAGAPNTAAGFQNVTITSQAGPVSGVPVPPAFLGTILGGVVAALRGLKQKSEASA